MNPSPFRRYLSPQAVEAALPLGPWLAALDGAMVELRQGDGISVYRRGRRALQLLGLGGSGPTLRVADGPGEPLASLDPTRLQAAWEWACGEIDAGRRGGERDLVAGLLRAGLADFVVVDQEVQIPSAALADLRGAGVRVDVLLLDRSGALWLVEAKRADGEDLHEVPEQLERTTLLPDTLRGGREVFTAHYREVVAQKRALGLLPDGEVSGELRVALLVIGPRRRALERATAWEQLPQGARGAVVDRTLCPADFTPLEGLAAEAAEGLRSGVVIPVAPRPSRHTRFAKAEEAFHARQPAPGALSGPVRAYLAAHDARAHTHAEHHRSSQRACLDALTPAFLGGAGAESLLGVLASAFEGIEARPIQVAAVDFEVPHQRGCVTSGCRVSADMRALVGESDPRFITRLDAALAVEAERDGRPIRVLVGVEFKYTEPEFGCCGGFVSNGNPDEGRRACLGGDRVASCYLLHAKGRRYLRDRSMFEADPLTAAGPCLLLGPANQLYRSHYTTRALARAWGYDDHLFVVIADARNESLRLPEPAIPGVGRPELGPYEQYRAALTGAERARIHWTSPQAIAAALATRGETLPARYRWA